jgi:organic radical activating enzyme
MINKYLQKLKEELNLEYNYNFSDLLCYNSEISLFLLALNLKEESQLYKKEFLSLARSNFLKTLKKVEERSIRFLRKTINTTDNLDFLISGYKECIKLQEYNIDLPIDLIKKCWPVVMAPNVFSKAFNEVPFPLYFENIKGVNLTKWGKDPYMLIEFSLFVKCPVDCSYCPHESLNAASKEKYIDIEAFKLFLSKIPNSVGLVYAGFCEPLFYKNFNSVVKYAHSKNYRQFVATTLPDKFDDNLDVFFNESLWAGRSIHLRDEHMKYKVENNYYKNLDKFFRQMHFNKNEKLDNRFSFLGETIDKKIILLLKKYNLIHLHTKLKPYQRIESPIEYEQAEKGSFLAGSIYCTRGFYKKQMVVPGGDVVLCCMDVEKKHILGNLNKTDYHGIYNSTEYKRVINGFNDEKENIICRKCVYAKQIDN